METPVRSEADGAPEVVGDFTPADLEAIKALITRADLLPMLSIVWLPGEDVEVTTGIVRGRLNGSGNHFRLRKVGGTWTILRRGGWIS